MAIDHCPDAADVETWERFNVGTFHSRCCGGRAPELLIDKQRQHEGQDDDERENRKYDLARAWAIGLARL